MDSELTIHPAQSDDPILEGQAMEALTPHKGRLSGGNHDR
jgi:hypothetical protein